MLFFVSISENIVEDINIYDQEKDQKVKEQIRDSINQIASEFETLIINTDKLSSVEQGLLDVSSSGFMDQGIVTSFKDGIAIVKGLKNVRSGHLVEIITQDSDNSSRISNGLVFNLNSDSVSIGTLTSDADVREGSSVYSLEEPLTVYFSSEIFGSVIDPLGDVINDPMESEDIEEFFTFDQLLRHVLTPYYLDECLYEFVDEVDDTFSFPKLMVERKAPGILLRQSVRETLVTGVKVIDSLFPIGRGQRELIIGDRKTGKTALSIDFIIQQSKLPYASDNVFCIYVAVGQKQSSVLETFERLRSSYSSFNTVIVSASASDSATLQFVAPYVGTAIGEFFRDRGKHALIVYDDLSKHAVAYREISLNLRRPPGREAFPGDVFYLHSRLLERSAKLADEVGGGSLTGIPIVETQAGDVSAYIPTNVISITDGQIVLNADLFNNGIRPAVDIGLSVSRVGSAAQSVIIKAIVSTLKLELAQYRDIAGFTKLGTELDEATQKILDRGRIYETLLIQKPYRPLNTSTQALLLTAAMYGFLDNVKLEDIARFENELLRYIDHLYVNRYKPENNHDLLTIGIVELLVTDDPVSLDIIVSHQNQAIFIDSIIYAYHKFLKVFSQLWDSRDIWL